MKEAIRDILAQHAQLSMGISRVRDDDDLFLLGMTSHATVSVMLALEDTFSVEFPEQMLRRSTFESPGAIERALRQLGLAGEVTELDARS